jgi:hypothetical protein
MDARGRHQDAGWLPQPAPTEYVLTYNCRIGRNQRKLRKLARAGTFSHYSGTWSPRSSIPRPFRKGWKLNLVYAARAM